MEIWKPVVGYEEFYEVSDHGRIRNIKDRKNTHVGRILVGGRNPQGYKIAGLRNGGKKRFYKSFHSIVMEAFVGPLNGMCVNHKDGIKNNNNISNLEYVTVQQNNEHAKKNGLLRPNKGEDNGSSKLTNKDVIRIRELYESKEKSQTELSYDYDVMVSCISRIVNRKRWAHLK